MLMKNVEENVVKQVGSCNEKLYCTAIHC